MTRISVAIGNSMTWICENPGSANRLRVKTTRLRSSVLDMYEEVTPQTLFLDTKPFVISTDQLFQVDAYF